ncbi:MAG: vWA domain-containing protein, partial [Bacteroidota bacterium]
LQNTLYLQVVRPDGTVLDGDTTPFPTATNNVQQVLIDTPAPGTYEVRVRGVAVNQQAPGASPGVNPRQDFALVVSNGIGFSTQPVSIAQAIDTTGSMGTFGYLEPAQERARQLVDFMRANDKVSITEFSQRPGVPADARTPYPLRLLGSFTPDWADAHAAIGGLNASGLTPIGAGLAEAWNQLASEPVGRPRAIVLLSDGLNNRPPDPASVLPGIPADVPIFTIALGPAGSVPTLQSIANSRPGGSYYAVQSDEDVHRLHEVYAQVQALAAGTALVGLTSDAVESKKEQDHEMPVEPGVEEATFTLSWNEGANVEEMKLVAVGPDSRRYNASVEATFERHGRSYHLVRVAVPKAGRWRLIVQNRGSRQPVKYTLSGAARSSLVLSAEMRSLKQERLQVQARLQRGGKPWGDARMVARITMPTRSREEILERFGDKIRAVRLPDEVQEKGLSEEHVFLLKESFFAREFAEKEGGLYGRKTFEVEMKPGEDGLWTAELPLQAPGGIHAEVLGFGEIGGHAWKRCATQSMQVTLPEHTPGRLRIEEIFTRRNRRWKHTIIGVRVRRPDGALAVPEDRVVVRAVVKQNGHEVTADTLDYYNRGDYFIWRLPKTDVKDSGEADVSVEVRQAELVVTETVTDAAHITL